MSMDDIRDFLERHFTPADKVQQCLLAVGLECNPNLTTDWIVYFVKNWLIDLLDPLNTCQCIAILRHWFSRRIHICSPWFYDNLGTP